MAAFLTNDVDPILLSVHRAVLAMYANKNDQALKNLEMVWPQVVRLTLFECRASWGSEFLAKVLQAAADCQSHSLQPYVPLEYKMPQDVAVLYETVRLGLDQLPQSVTHGVLRQFHALMPVLVKLALANTSEPFGSDYQKWLGQLDRIGRDFANGIFTEQPYNVVFKG